MAVAGNSVVGDCVGFVVTNKYNVYVLVTLMLVYMVNQLSTFCLVATNVGMAQDIGYGDRECAVTNQSAIEDYIQDQGLNITAEDFCASYDNNDCVPDAEFAEKPCYWHYLGKGLEYQLLAGPLYIVLFSISGIPLGLVSELNGINRKYFLVACAVLWSLMTILNGFAQTYWHLALARILMGIFSAGCVPFCASIISDYFDSEQRGAALGLYNWGIFLGYSLTFVLLLVEQSLGWRAVYFCAGIPGVLLSILLLLTVTEPERKGNVKEKALDQFSGTFAKLKTAAGRFLEPGLLLLCLGGAIRNGGGIVWAYNIAIFFEEYHPGTRIEAWMSWLPLVFGSLGAFGGGALSDRLSRNRGLKGRMMVLIVCLILSAPFEVGTLLLPMPWAFIMQIPALVIGEMWIGVCVAVVIDLVPIDLTASAVAVYFFIIQIIGGNMNLLVPPLENVVGLRIALIITFPGAYILGALIFLLTLFVVLRTEKTVYDLTEDNKGDLESSSELSNEKKELPDNSINSSAKLMAAESAQ